jgi:protein-tyrosine phosphatase
MGMPRTILFLCTGNYYRSRFAEELFNTLATAADLDWRATSRALAIELGLYNVGPISMHAKTALAARGIALPEPIRPPQQVTEEDLAGANRVIAMKEAEHRVYLSRRYPDWPDRVEYWHIHDLDKATADEALSQISDQVTALVKELASGVSFRE